MNTSWRFKRPRPNARNKKQGFPKIKLYDDLPVVISNDTNDERAFIREWCEVRQLEESHIVVSTTYWLRCKSHIYTSFLMFPEAKDLYIILCVHLALKHLGYDEVHKCNFLLDLVEVYPSMNEGKHQEMEWELFRTLNFDMGI